MKAEWMPDNPYLSPPPNHAYISNAADTFNEGVTAAQIKMLRFLIANTDGEQLKKSFELMLKDVETI